MAREIVLHIGAEKTGTTFLQGAFSADRAQLARGGVLYSSMPPRRSHLSLAAAAIGWERIGEIAAILGTPDEAAYDALRRQVETTLAEEVAAAPNILLISSEHLQSRVHTPQQMERLVALLDRLDSPVRVIGYLRRQDRAAVSRYSTFVASGGARPFAFPPASRKGALPHFFDYWSLWRRWSDAFGAEAVSFRSYEEAKSAPGGLLADFAEWVGVAPPRPAKDRNESLSAAAIGYLAAVNAHVPRVVDNAVNPAHRRIRSFISRTVDGPRFVPDLAAAAAFQAQFEPGNRALAEALGRTAPLFDDGPIDGAPTPSFAMDDLVDITADALTRLSKQRAHGPA